MVVLEREQMMALPFQQQNGKEKIIDVPNIYISEYIKSYWDSQKE